MQGGFLPPQESSTLNIADGNHPTSTIEHSPIASLPIRKALSFLQLEVEGGIMASQEGVVPQRSVGL